MRAFFFGAWSVARTVGATLTRDLWPTWQAGLQDAQTNFTRMTLDQPPGASVPGLAGNSTQRDIYELQHAEVGPDPPPVGQDWAADFEQWQQQAAQAADRGPRKDRGLGMGE